MDDHNLANSLYRVIRPAATTMLEQIQRHLLSPWAGIRRIHQQQTMIPPGLDLMKIDNEVDRLTNTCATPRAILDTAKIDKQIEDMANHKSFQNRIDILKHHLPTPTIWGKPFFLRELGIIAIPHIMEEFADSELVTVVREIVCSLRDDKEIGDKLEKIVEDNLSDMLREKLGIKVSKISRNQHFHLDNENGEIDLVVECEGVLIFLVEVKKTIDDKKITHFINNNASLFIKCKGATNTEKIYGIIAYGNGHKNAIDFAKKRGLLICRISGGGLELVYPSDAQQLREIHLVCLDKASTQKTAQKCRKKKPDKQKVPHKLISYSKNADGTIPSFKIRSRPTKPHRKYLKRFLDMYDFYCRPFNLGLTAKAMADCCIISPEKFVADVLCGWGNIIGSDDGLAFLFSMENATKLFEDYPGFYEDIVLQTHRIWHNNLTDEAVR